MKKIVRGGEWRCDECKREEGRNEERLEEEDEVMKQWKTVI